MVSFLKKAFSQPDIFAAFVKAVLGIEFECEKVETEKSFKPRLAMLMHGLIYLRKTKKIALLLIFNTFRSKVTMTDFCIIIV